MEAFLHTYISNHIMYAVLIWLSKEITFPGPAERNKVYNTVTSIITWQVYTRRVIAPVGAAA